MTANKFLNLATSTLLSYRRYIQAGLTLCAGLGLSALASSVAYNWEYKSMQAELQDRLDKIATEIQREVSGNLEIIRAAGAFYSVFDGVKTPEMKTFVGPALYRHPSLKAIAWLPRLSDSPQFLTEEIDLTLGLTTNRLALENAIKRQEITATDRQKLSSQNQPSVFVFMPIFSQNYAGAGAELQQNLPDGSPKNLKGFTFGVLLVDAIVKSALQETNLDFVNVYLQDAMAPEAERFLAFYEAKTKRIITDEKIKNKIQMGERAYCPDGSSCTRIINIENRRWLLELRLTPEYINPLKFGRSLTVLILGTILTLVATLYLMSLLSYTEKIEKIAAERTAKSQELEKTLQELQQTQAQLIQQEKMSSLGLLVAGVAHEVNNPINFIYGNIHHASEYTRDLFELVKLYQKNYLSPPSEISEYLKNIDFDFLSKDLPQLLSSMKIGADRIVQIVQSLRNFSRLDESEMKPVNIHEGIDSTLLILQSRLKATADRPPIEIVKNYSNLPLVECYAGQLNQVFMNILANAIDALESYNLDREPKAAEANPIAIAITTEYSVPDKIIVRISDNGPGMAENVKKRLFDPFFTTKPVGKGTGLGLSISYKIVVEKHKGTLRCDSTPGLGTEFSIEIPLRQEVRQAVPFVSRKISEAA
ncbi:ATP-binding protein [Microcoleus vaginatus]|uniref:ATP-binding protein n=1 Tax=Microcoleus vaginatus TaxID=119532 RepID=UPI0016825941|nr:CHASE domain-containing protein [Microcoleus sp. FACHB-84]MBD2011974.1 CHASE domain-containing protein [Microcoleus sp. FACHB-45]